MQANLKTNAQLSNFDTESVVITRKAATASGGTFAITTIYSGACDFQSERGTPFYNPSGVVDVSDAVLYIDSSSPPTVDIGDKAKVTQNSISTDYTVVNTTLYTFPLSRLEIALKQGPLDYKSRR